MAQPRAPETMAPATSSGYPTPTQWPRNDSDSDTDLSSDLSDIDWSAERGQDFTKQYNRQKRTQEFSADPNAPKRSLPKQNPQGPKLNTRAYVDDQITSLSRHTAKLRLNDNQAGLRLQDKGAKDKSDRATSEQVLDPRTRMILLQMINRGVVSEIHGCISTGKEANVYYAIKDEVGEGPRKSLAVKVYKTAILSFKDRSRYVEGEYRFQSGSKVGSNRKMVKMWAEKEMRNLSRIYSAKIPCPKPEYLRLHVLAMGFLGDKTGWPAPRLHDVQLEIDQWSKLATLLLAYMRIMYQVCRLVHGDLSEYNVLYHEEKPFVIDVSQSVEHDHPRSLELLRMDVKNITSFFRRQRVKLFSEKCSFEFITDASTPVELSAILKTLDELSQKPDSFGAEDVEKQEVDDAVFRQSYMPQTLNEVYDFEKDAKISKSQDFERMVTQKFLAKPTATARLSDQSEEHVMKAESLDDGVSANDPESDSTSGSETDESAPKKPRGRRFEDKDEKHGHKMQVKEEKREKRKEKMPKHVKKRLVEKKSHHKKK